MSEAEKQEGQKTVVAFITGLLIGGLLVWVFSSTPDTQVTETTETPTTEESSDSTDQGASVVSAVRETTDTVTNTVVGDGKISLGAQTAGDAVALGEVSYPAKEGWIVVRDYADGAAGRILGAARYNLDDGLLPTEVTLLRKTVSGNTYQVQFYTENGDKAFDTKSDVAVSGGETTFKAN